MLPVNALTPSSINVPVSVLTKAPWPPQMHRDVRHARYGIQYDPLISGVSFCPFPGQSAR